MNEQLPPALRKTYGLDQPGAQIEVTEREDGVIEMRAVLPVPASQKWFWDERWQAGERDGRFLIWRRIGDHTIYANP